MSAAGEVWAVLEPALDGVRAATDQPWTEQRALLVERVQYLDSTVTEALFEWLDGLSDDERADLIGSDRLAVEAYELVRAQAPEDETVPSEEQAGGTYDADVWNAYLLENGGAWDGTEESWAAFREWFEYYAAERGVGEPAAALLEHLTGLPAADRPQMFAQYGVTIAAPTAEPLVEPEPEPVAVEPVAAEPEPEPEPVAAEPVPEPVAEVTPEQDRFAAQIAAEVPGIAQLSEDELARILAEVAAETGR